MSTISAGTLLSNALVQTGDTSGNLVFQTNGNTTAMTIDTNQNVTYANGVSFTGVIAGNGANISSMNASNLTSGTVATARLASGTANSSTYLRGDQTWAVLSAPNNGTLTMNTSGTGLTGSATFTADQSGNSTFTVTSNANSANGASTIVARDSSGNFTSNAVTLTTGSFSGGSNTAPSITFTGDTNTGIYSPAADTIAFSEGGVEAMRLDSSANLNMSTVGGKVNFATTSSATVNYIGVPADGFSLELACQRGASQPFVYKLDFANGHIWSTAGSERMRIDTSGNVGIGTSSVFDSNTRLELSKSGNCQQFISSTDASGVRIYLSAQGSTSANFGAFSNHALSFRTNDTERGRFDTSGNFLFNSGYGSVATAYGCRAWVNFNGQTNAIRGSGNVSSISDRGFGLYTVNFTNAMPDTNYSVAGIISSDVTTQAIIFIGSTSADMLTSSVRIDACNPNVGNIERQVVCVQIFR